MHCAIQQYVKQNLNNLEINHLNTIEYQIQKSVAMSADVETSQIQEFKCRIKQNSIVIVNCTIDMDIEFSYSLSSHVVAA